MSEIVISLTQGQRTIVDASDAAWLSQWKWSAHRSSHGGKKCRNWYAKRTEHGRLVLMHRLIMSAPPGVFVDHVNRDSLDNRRSNLRFATTSQNTANQPAIPGSRSPYKGVAWNSRLAKWQVFVVRQYVGVFADEVAAARAYDAIAKERFGEYAYLNFPVAS